MTDKIKWEGGQTSVAWHKPKKADTYVVLAHGAGGDMNTPSLKGFADGLAARGIGAVRFNFAYADAGKKAPDRQPILEACYRAVADAVAREADVLVLGGRSMGGRIASHIVSEGYPAAGLLFLAYPLHPPGKPEKLRDEHLKDIKAPMLFLQGTRDSFAQPDLLEKTVKMLPKATLYPLEGGDHSHKVKGRKPDDVVDELVDVTVGWLEKVG